MPILSHKIRIYPSPEAEVYLRKSCGTARFAYNWALAQWKKEYAEGSKPSAFKLNAEFNATKGIEFPWTSEVSKYCSQQAILNLGRSFEGFFKKISRYPRFKKKGVSKSSFYLGSDVVQLCGKYLKLPKLKKPIKMAESLRFSGKINSVVISNSANEWYASFSVNLDDSYVYPHKCESQAVVGVDLGIKNLATCSDGTKFENPRALARGQRKLVRLQRSLSRKKKGSKNRGKAKVLLARAHMRVARIRADAMHRLTSWLVKTFRFIGVEDLNLRGMLKNHCLARALSDVAFGEFQRQLSYKAPLAGSHVVRAERFFPSSKTCHCCGHVLEELLLSTREWECPGCGAAHDRDGNASQNLELVAARYAETLNACGEDVRPGFLTRPRRSSMKQECQESPVN